MQKPAKFLCTAFHLTHKEVKIKNGIINSKSKILILLEERMVKDFSVVLSYAP